ncbi:MAG TPA: hypothetical protein VM597_40150, partial [Gemmataceae bacterium]|nr:hypothetical protein [Gemmataceae bacterium]
IVAELAGALGLTVPARSLVTLHPGTPTDDPDQELGDLLAASVGPNLGFTYLAKARDFGPDDLPAVPADTRAAVLWLDRLTLNPDRTAANPNLMLSGGRVHDDGPGPAQAAGRPDPHCLKCFQSASKARVRPTLLPDSRKPVRHPCPAPGS